jgi:hypothetical protein
MFSIADLNRSCCSINMTRPAFGMVNIYPGWTIWLEGFRALYSRQQSI